MKTDKKASWTLPLALAAAGLPFACLKLGLVAERRGLDMALPLALVIGLGIGAYCATCLASDRSIRAAIGIFYLPGMLYLLFLVGQGM